MADPPPYPDTGSDSGERGSADGIPRWVTVLVSSIAIVLILLLVVLHSTGALGSGAH